jgi:hypothetical protein
MKKLVVTVVLGAAAMLVTTQHVFAQESSPRFSVEGRFGVINVPSAGFLDLAKGNHFSLGVLGSYRPIAKESLLNRLTFRVSLDGAGLGGENVDVGLKDVERLYLVNFALGLDALRASRGSITIHGGGAIARDHFVVQEFSGFGGTFGSGGFVGACSAAPGLCQSIWNFLGNGGVEGRVYPKKNWSMFFVGADYTRFAGTKNQTVFTTGISF